MLKTVKQTWNEHKFFKKVTIHIRAPIHIPMWLLYFLLDFKLYVQYYVLLFLLQT